MTDEQKTEQEIALENAQKAADVVNQSRTGKGTRLRVGQTRGRNPQVISYEAFDESKPDTHPVTLTEFMDLVKIQDEKTIVSFLMDGFNSTSYTTASDPIAEYVEKTWPEEIQKTFRTVVRNYASGANIGIDDAVKLIKPGIVAMHGPKA